PRLAGVARKGPGELLLSLLEQFRVVLQLEFLHPASPSQARSERESEKLSRRFRACQFRFSQKPARARTGRRSGKRARCRAFFWANRVCGRAGTALYWMCARAPGAPEETMSRRTLRSTAAWLILVSCLLVPGLMPAARAASYRVPDDLTLVLM